MVFKFHQDAQQQFDQQRLVTDNTIIPFIESAFPLREGLHVLEIGCGEGGVIKAFVDRGCIGTGIELDEQRYTRAEHLLQEELQQGRVRLIRNDIYSVGIDKDFESGFHLVILKDVIEHIPDQERLLRRLAGFLQPGGVIFVSFPPWQMPFGGHQQVCDSKVLSLTPYLHLLPALLYRGVLNLFGETEKKIEQLLEVKRTGISLERFERLAVKAGFGLIKRTLYLINPIYQFKFGLKPRQQFRLITGLPYFRDLLTTCGYYLARPEAPQPATSG
ncbi:MAG: methyltransferase domain-containing protein [Fidelibacterota bacterium]|nr:MAG: methyltransferase domain-containing protein [Candidatus Neomarinimicrobiota bacterium]